MRRSVISGEGGIAVIIGPKRTTIFRVDEEPLEKDTKFLSVPRLFQNYSDVEVYDNLAIDEVRQLLFESWKADRIVRLIDIIEDANISEGVRSDAAIQLSRLRRAQSIADVLISREQEPVSHVRRPLRPAPDIVGTNMRDNLPVEPTADITSVTAEIVAAHISNNSVTMSELPMLIRNVHGALSGLGSGAEFHAKQEPAVPISASVRPDYLVCLEDGKKLKMLKRHLMTRYQMTPDEYRTKWNLPPAYPMVAPRYSEQRRQMAKRIGFGSQRGRKVAKQRNS